MVSSKVVEDNNSAAMDSRAQHILHEVNEAWLVHRADHRVMAHDAVSADGADHRDVFAPIRGLLIANSNSARRTPVGRRHRDVAARLVEEDQVVDVDGTYLFEERATLFLDVGAVLLGGSERLFFRVIPARASARFMLDSLSSTEWREAQTSHNSATVRSGFSATSCTNNGRLSSLISGGFPPPRGSRSTLPRSRLRRRSLETLAAPTPNVSATSA
jgi:hypothetical protein